MILYISQIKIMVQQHNIKSNFNDNLFLIKFNKMFFLECLVLCLIYQNHKELDLDFVKINQKYTYLVEG